MTQKDKKLLLNDLCARLRYGIKVLDITFKKYGPSELINIGIDGSMLVDNKTNNIQYYPIIDNVKPYLRPMSSMTEEEYAKLKQITITSPNLETAVTLFWEHYYDEAPNWRNDWTYCALPKVLDWLNEHHFDYRGLIEKGLALEALEGMYETE